MLDAGSGHLQCSLRHPPRVGHTGLLTACILLPSGQMCCNPAEMPAGTGRAAGLGLSILHVSSFTGGDKQKAGSSPKSRGHAPKAACSFPAETLSAPSSSENPQPHSGKMKGKKQTHLAPNHLWGSQLSKLRCAQTDPSASAAPRPLCWGWAAEPRGSSG